MSGQILVYDSDNKCLVAGVVTCYYCKYAVRGKPQCVGDPGFNPEDIVCAYHMSDGFDKNDFCSYGEIGDYRLENKEE